MTVIHRRVRPLVAGLAALASLAVILSCGWLAMMELLLQRPAYGWRVLVEAALVVESALTLAAVENLVSTARLRWPLGAGAAATGLLGWWVVAEDLSRPGLPARPHFEGYLLIIGLALIVYGALTTVAMFRVAPRRSPRASASRS